MATSKGAGRLWVLDRLKKAIAHMFLLLVFAITSACVPVLQNLNSYEPDAYKAQERYESIRIVAEGNGADRSYAFFPDDGGAMHLPLIVFLHGWQGTSPKNYGAFIDHLVRRGSVVVFPVYQTGANTPPQGITNTAATSIKAMIKHLNRQYPKMIDEEKTLYYGYSMGASIAINFAMRPDKFKLPKPLALLLTAPGDAYHVAKGAKGKSILYRSLSHLPKELPIVLMTGQEDTSIGLPTAISHWNQICSQKRLKRLIIWPGGKSETQSIHSGHGAAGAPDKRYDFSNIYGAVPATMPRLKNFPVSKSLNNLDFYGQWKVVVSYLEAVRESTNPEWIFSRDEIIEDLGTFANGKAYPKAILVKQCPAQVQQYMPGK